MMVEVHPNPEEALCDADQALTPAIFSDIMTRLRPLKSFMNELPSQ
jgi:3-deoxy-7-phosphoheptulonate synthase